MITDFSVVVVRTDRFEKLNLETGGFKNVTGEFLPLGLLRTINSNTH